MRTGNAWKRVEQLPIAIFILKWILIASIIGAAAGCTSAFFLRVLDDVTLWRESHLWIIVFLPLGGFLVGLMYHYLGREVEAGNNLLIDEIHNPRKIIHLKMAPLVLIGTLMTHFFGGSAGREGTAVQMGGSLADQLNHIIKFRPRDRMVILICGISGGFASVFGTPLSGAVFGLEVFLIGRLRYNAIFPAFISAIIGNYVCDAWGIKHSVYKVLAFPEISLINILFCCIAGVAFGLTALVFSKFNHKVSEVFKSKVSYPPFRPLIGGVILALGIWALGTTRYIGLGLPVIHEAFIEPLPEYDFAFKILFTVLTIGAGFKGGEVTPLFFIGATLGNALSLLIPLPMDLLAGLGFVAVFAGAANAPLATMILAIELFGVQIGVFAAISCVVAYLFTGHTGIYGSQILGESKHLIFGRESGTKIKDIPKKFF